MLEQELSSPDLTEIDGEFYREFDSLIKALKLSAESSRERGEDIEERLYLAQLGIAERLMREIIKIRLHKIVDLAFEGVPYGMAAEERRIFAVLRAFIEGEGVPAEAAVDTEKPPETHHVEESQKKALPLEAYIIKMDIPKVLGPEMKEYGPFRAGDLVTIPGSIGRVLVERDAAERVKISP
nr:hypothetical protein [Thermococcus sp. M36]